MISLADLEHIGAQFLDVLRTRGVRVNRPAPNYGVGGTYTLSAASGNLQRGQLVQVGSWESGDGVAKAVTITVTANSGTFLPGIGAYAKVRYGDQRGATYQWLPVPGTMTVVATSVSVQAQLGGTPYRLIATNPANVIAPPFIAPGLIPGGTTYTAPVTCLIRDASPADDPALILLRGNIVLSDVPLNVIEGPVYIESLELNNEAAADVGVIWGEGDGSVLPDTQIGSVIVPAGGSIGVASPMLGAVASGFVIAPVVSLVNSSTGAPVISPDAGSITANVSGFYLPVM